MADYSPNYTAANTGNYVSPQQLDASRAYAAALLKRSSEPVNRPAGAVAAMIDALTGNLERNRANELQSEAAGRNSAGLTGLISQLQNGQKIDPATAARVYADPMASPEHRALIAALVTPKGLEDVRGRQGFVSPAAGVTAAPVQGNFEQGYRAPETAGTVSTVSPIPAPRPAPATPPGMTRLDPQAMDDWRRQNPLPSPGGSRIDELAAKDRELTAAKTFSQGGAESVSDVQKQDVASAMQAPSIRRIAGVMLDDLNRHGDQMTFGPTAQWSNEIKRAAANYLPGPMKSQLETLASADSFDKMSAQLTSLLARGGGGTDAQLFNSMRSVPGSHNSKQGAEALLKMTLQVADQQTALRDYVAAAKTPAEYEQLRNRFFAENPVINPITGNPIRQDIEAQRRSTGGGAGGGARILSVRPAN